MYIILAGSAKANLLVISHYHFKFTTTSKQFMFFFFVFSRKIEKSVIGAMEFMPKTHFDYYFSPFQMVMYVE